MSEDPAELQRFYEETVAPLVAYDEQYETDLVQTLETFLDADGNVAGTAARLYTHRHTVRYRLERVKRPDRARRRLHRRPREARPRAEGDARARHRRPERPGHRGRRRRRPRAPRGEGSVRSGPAARPRAGAPLRRLRAQPAPPWPVVTAPGLASRIWPSSGASSTLARSSPAGNARTPSLHRLARGADGHVEDERGDRRVVGLDRERVHRRGGPGRLGALVVDLVADLQPDVVEPAQRLVAGVLDPHRGEHVAALGAADEPVVARRDRRTGRSRPADLDLRSGSFRRWSRSTVVTVAPFSPRHVPAAGCSPHGWSEAGSAARTCSAGLPSCESTASSRSKPLAERLLLAVPGSTTLR